METIGLIAAMQQESGALLRLIKKWKRITLGPYRGAHFQILDRNCILITSGMGLKRAKDATRILLTKESPQLIISFGIAGAPNVDLQIGDVVVARSACLLENGLPGRLKPLASMSKAAWNAANQALQPYEANLVFGTTITTRGSQVFLQRSEEMPYPILEMETAGIAHVAAEMGIPLLSIRSISDGPQSPIPLDLEAALDDKDNLRIGKLLLMALRHPQIIFHSGHIIQNSKIAADHAALSLVAALNQPLPMINS
jgi:adenosylhomocysteine nucleosidase